MGDVPCSVARTELLLNFILLYCLVWYGMGQVTKQICEENSELGKGKILEKFGLGTGILNGLQRFTKHSGLE